MALDFPTPSQVGQLYTDPSTGKTYQCVALGPPAVWGNAGTVPVVDDDFVTIDTDQSITGAKAFTATNTSFVNVNASGNINAVGNITTSDLIMSNMHLDGNEVDGTTGHWCFQEGKTTVYVINRLTGQRYNMNLEPVDE